MADITALISTRRSFPSFPAPLLEATGNWHWLVELVEAKGQEVLLSHPKQKLIAHARLKNDRVDAERLAYLLRTDLLPEVWIPPVELRHAKELLRHRFLQLRFRTALLRRSDRGEKNR